MMRQLQHRTPSWSDLNLALRVVHTTLRHGPARTKFLGIKSYFYENTRIHILVILIRTGKTELNPFRGIL